jgi:hypothetical protein
MSSRRRPSSTVPSTMNDGRTVRGWAGALAAFGVWGVTAPYIGPPLGFHVPVEPRLEFIDHVVPGLVILGIAAVAIVTRRVPLAAALAGFLAGFWMFGTHVPLVALAARGRIDWASALWHSLPGGVLLALCLVAVARAWSSARSTP